jgi:predicted kinase
VEVARQATRPTMYVLIGLPGSGKTRRARELELERRALRLTPDEWMIPLFGEPEAEGKRDVLEGRLVWLAMRALRLGVNVVLDFGAWGRGERSALRSLAAEAGAECQLVYLPVHEVEQLRRVQTRSIEDPGSTFETSPEDLQQFNQQFQAPDEEELTSGEIDPAPAGYPSWKPWAAERWPTSID